MGRILAVILVMTIFCGCSLLNKAAIRTTADVVKEGSNEVLTEGNWTFFKQATPGNIKMLEGLWFSDKENTTLLTMLVKAHVAYAFTVHETSGLEDLLLDKSDSFHKEQAIIHYEKALYYGLKYLEIKGIDKTHFYAKDFSLQVKNIFDESLDQEDEVLVFYLAQALGSTINLQRQNVSKMALLNHVKAMLSWVCERSPEIERGSCGLFQAVLEGSTPTLLGGNLQKAKKMFLTLIKRQPYNLMARLSYIQYYLIPMLEEDDFAKEMRILGKDLDLWYSGIKDLSQRDKKFLGHQDFNLFNAMARKRYNILKQVKSDIF